MLKKGDMVELRDGIIAVLTSDTYTHRHLDWEDHEMIANGMGEYAGTYCTAFNALVPSTGRSLRLIYGKDYFKEIKNTEEGDVN